MPPPPDDATRTGTSRATVALAIRSGAMGAVVTFLFNLVLLPIVLDELGPDIYGAWIALAAFIAVGSLADAGIRTEIARRVAGAHGANDRGAMAEVTHLGTTVMCLTVVPVALAGVLLAPQLAELVFPDGVRGYASEDVHLLLRLMLCAMAVNLILGAHLSALRGVQRSDVDAVAQVAGLPVHAGVLLVGVWSGWGLWSLLSAQLAGMAVTLVVQAIGMRRLLPWLPFRLVRAPWPTIGAYLSLSSLALVSQVGDVFDSQWDKLVVSRFVGPEAVTAFHIGTMIVLQAKVLALLPMTPLLAGIAELRVGRAEEARSLQTHLMKAGAVTGSVILGGTFAFAPAFITLWLGPGYEDAGVVARIFVVAVALNLVSAPIAFQAFAEGLHRIAAAAALTNIVVNAVSSLVLTVQVGLYGAVIGSVIGNLVGTAAFFVFVRRRLSTWVRPPHVSPLLMVGVVALMVFLDVDEIDSWPVLLAAGTAFAVSMTLVCTRAEGIALRRLRELVGRGSP